jgi:NADH-quinone oxidoreductase subunit G
MPRITVDGIEFEVAEGRTILQALDDLGVLMNGVDIPHYCWHPKLSIDGSCRLCQVEVEGVPKLQIACNTPVADGMKIHTQTERVQNAREGVMELLLVNHPLDCPICDQAGECKLQDYAFEYGQQHARTREPRRALAKRVDLGPTIVFDQERCILCRRCVRFCREVPETGELAVFARGDHSVIDTFPDTPLANDYSMNVADICPVGALTTKDFRFKIRVWFLEEMPGVCTGCARGCNVYAGVANNRVYRYTPRRNDAVNQTWLCDEGRLTYKRIGADDRIDSAAIRSPDGVAFVGFDDAVAAAAERIGRVMETKGAGAVGLLVSPHATNEDLFVARRFAASLGTTQTGFALVRGRKDTLLIHEEKAANAAGARALGFEEAGAMLGRARGGAVEALVVMGQDVLSPAYADALATLSNVDTLVLLDTHRSHLESLAHVVIPVRHAAEKYGTLTNADGRVQRVEPAVEPSFDARSEGEVLWRLGQALGLAGFEEPYDVHALSKAMAQSVPALAGAGA